jgi:hypothetical protein
MHRIPERLIVNGEIFGVKKGKTVIFLRRDIAKERNIKDCYQKYNQFFSQSVPSEGMLLPRQNTEKRKTRQ